MYNRDVFKFAVFIADVPAELYLERGRVDEIQRPFGLSSISVRPGLGVLMGSSVIPQHVPNSVQWVDRWVLQLTALC